MTDIKELLAIRTARNRKKPAFVRKDTYIKAKVKANWRKPRGKHSPVREQHKGRPKLVSPGYGSPKAVRHLHQSGLKIVRINNLKELDNINNKTHGLFIANTVGGRKRIEMIKLALKNNLQILNLKEPQKYLENLESDFKKRQEFKKKKLTDKEKREEEKKKSAADKKEKSEKKDEKVEINKSAPEDTKDETETKKAKKVEPKTEAEKEKADKKEIEKTLIKKQ